MIEKKNREINILGHTCVINFKREHGGGSFSLGAKGGRNEIVVYIEPDGEKSDEVVFQVLCHELSELIHALLNTRYHSSNTSTSGGYMFVMDDNEFELHNSLFSIALYEFLKKDTGNDMLSFPGSVNIAGREVLIATSNKESSSFYNMNDNTGAFRLNLGTTFIKSNESYFWGILVECVSELAHGIMHTKYEDFGADTTGKFIMTHKQFQNHNMVLCSALLQFLL